MSSPYMYSLRCHAITSHSVFVSATRSFRDLHRHISTQSKSGKIALEEPAPDPIKAVSQKPRIQVLQRSPAVNPPESTLPPHLEIAERKSGESTPRYYFRIGKSYLGFYKTAFKAIWSNHRESKAIAARIPAKRLERSSVPFAAAALSGHLTRAEFQFILRSRKDVKKLPLLGILLIICGEYLPLIAVFFTGLVPRTAWIPKQTERSRRKIEDRREQSFRNGTLNVKDSLPTISRYRGVEDLTQSQILHVSRALGLHSTLWEKFWDRPPGWLARTRVRKAIDYLLADDHAIARDGGVKSMSDEEIKMASEERGIDVLKEDVPTVRNRLELYLQRRIKDGIGVPAMVLVRPNQWKELSKGQK